MSQREEEVKEREMEMEGGQRNTGNAKAPEPIVRPTPPRGNTAGSSTQYVDPAYFYGHPYPYGAVPSTYATAPAADSDYALFMSEFATGGSAGGAAAYEARRATRQLGHYLPPSQTPSSVQPTTATANAAQRKPTQQELKLFKKRKEERKRIRNKWLFE